MIPLIVIAIPRARVSVADAGIRVNVIRIRRFGRRRCRELGVSVRCMTDRRLPPGALPGIRRGPRVAARLHLVFHSMRRHVDFCRTATAICRD
jgi:hypothetical protein